MSRGALLIGRGGSAARPRPPAAPLKFLGPLVALAGLALATAVGWGVGYSLGPLTDRWDQDELWIVAGCIYAAGAVLALGCGHLLCGARELFRSGPAARRFLLAERRHLTARGGIVGRVGWAVVLMGGLVVWMLPLLDNDGGWSGRFGNDLMEAVAVLMTIAAFGLSVLVPLVLAVSGAVGLAASRRSGAAENLLMGPAAADYLGWASAAAQGRRGAWMLLACVPCCAAAALLLCMEWQSYVGPDVLAAALLILAVILLAEFLMFRRAAALGAWLGAAVRTPALAGALAAVGAIVLWLVRLGAVALCEAVAWELFRGGVVTSLRSLRFWYWPLAGLAWEVACHCVLVPVLLWLSRGALRAPVGLRLGAWMIRAGERLSGLGGEGAAEAAERFGLGRPAESDPWKLRMAGMWGLAFLLFMCFPITGAIIQEFSRGPTSYKHAGWAFSTCLGAVILVSGAVFLVGRVLARRVRSAGE